MPWSWLTRIFSGLLLYRFLRRGRGPAVPLDQIKPRLRRSLLHLREDVGMAGRLIATVVFGAGGALCASVALSLLTLGPRWVGIIAAVFSTILLGLAFTEAWRLRREVQRRRWRKRLEISQNDAVDDVSP